MKHFNHQQITHSTKQSQIALKVATTAILTAVGLLLSWINPFAYIPIFSVKINPFAHLINAIAGVLLGPIYAVIIATLIAILRFSFGIGSILAFPGGISGALVVGLIRELILRIRPKRVSWAALCEPFGTIFIGATIGSFLVSLPLGVLMGLFASSCIPGALIGWLILQIMPKAGLPLHAFIGDTQNSIV
jgi:energy coupling factor transporter S component ThiW